MHWIEELKSITTAVDAYFGALSNDDLSWKPRPDTWSIAQNLDHLIVVNETYFPVLAALKNGTYAPSLTAKAGFLVTFFEKTVLNAVQPDRSSRMKTFPIWQPANSTPALAQDIIGRFKRHQEALARQMHDASGLLIAPPVISSPANRLVVYRLNTAFDIIVTHEKRHVEQAKDVLAQLETHRRMD